MCFRVIAQQVAAGRHFPDQAGAFPYKFPDQKEGCAGGVAIEQIEKLRRDCRVGTVVKSERNFFWRYRVAYGWSVQFRRGGDSSPGRDSSCSRSACGREYGPGIQGVTCFNLRMAVACVPVGLRATTVHFLK